MGRSRGRGVYMQPDRWAGAGWPAPSHGYYLREPASSTSLSHKRTSNDTNQSTEQVDGLSAGGSAHQQVSGCSVLLSLDECSFMYSSDNIFFRKDSSDNIYMCKLNP